MHQELRFTRDEVAPTTRAGPASALADLDHPGIVRFFEAGEQDGRHYYAMEYVAGRNFEEVLRERGRLPWREVLDLALQVCPALKHAHDHGVIHRDLKPSNVLVEDQTGDVRITDCRVARLARGYRNGADRFATPEYATHANALYQTSSAEWNFMEGLYGTLLGRSASETRTRRDRRIPLSLWKRVSA